MNYLDGVKQKHIRTFREKAVQYYQEEGRKKLPWRETKDPWKILIAEILLRKTTAVQAESIYSELSVLSPEKIRDMPAKKLETILRPLGIYRERARLLKLIGEEVAEAGTGKLSDWEFLVNLPGVGWYAASMVLTSAFDFPKPALDRNMIRVLERIFSIKSDKARPHTDRKLWQAAEELVHQSSPREFNWGILDVSSALCRPRHPLCNECPFEEICDFSANL